MAARYAAVAAVLLCLAVATSASGTATSRITRQDSKAQFNARNLTSEVEACWTDTQDYTKCRTERQLSRGMGDFPLPIGRHPGQVRVAKAAKNSYTIDAYSRSGNHFLIVKSSSDRLTRKCTTRGRGLCRSNGRW